MFGVFKEFYEIGSDLSLQFLLNFEAVKEAS